MEKAGDLAAAQGRCAGGMVGVRNRWMTKRYRFAAALWTDRYYIGEWAAGGKAETWEMAKGRHLRGMVGVKNRRMTKRQRGCRPVKRWL